jgi:hypothetical protein
MTSYMKKDHKVSAEVQILEIDDSLFGPTKEVEYC